MINKLVAFSVLKTGEGHRVNTISTVIDDNGILVDSNKRESFFVVDPAMENKIAELEGMISNKLEQLNNN